MTSTLTYTVVDQRAGSPDGTETITGVENFQFADGAVASRIDWCPTTRRC